MERSWPSPDLPHHARRGGRRAVDRVLRAAGLDAFPRRALPGSSFIELDGVVLALFGAQTSPRMRRSPYPARLLRLHAGAEPARSRTVDACWPRPWRREPTGEAGARTRMGRLWRLFRRSRRSSLGGRAQPVLAARRGGARSSCRIERRCWRESRWAAPVDLILRRPRIWSGAVSKHGHWFGAPYLSPCFETARRKSGPPQHEVHTSSERVSGDVRPRLPGSKRHRSVVASRAGGQHGAWCESRETSRQASPQARQPRRRRARSPPATELRARELRAREPEKRLRRLLRRPTR